MKHILYKAGNANRFTKPIVKRIENKMRMIYAMDYESLVKKTDEELWKILMIAMVAFFVIGVAGKFAIYECVLGILIVYMLGLNSIYASYDKLEIKLLKQFDKFIQDVRFQFRFDGMLEEALTDSVQDAEYEMALQGNRMLDSLHNWKLDEVGDSYEDWAPNHFFLTFYALCETVIAYGDKKIDGKSLFLQNIGYLKEDINTEILKREKTNSLFMGLFGVTILPLFSIGFVAQWGMSNMPELATFYYGILGRIVNVLITILALIIFAVIMKLRYPVELHEHKSPWIESVSKSPGLNRLVMRRIARHYQKYYEMEKMLKSIVYPYNVKELMVKQVISGIWVSILAFVLCLAIGVAKIEVVGISGMGIILTALISILGFILAYNYEYFNIAIRKKILEINREEEVVRFQSIILILMYMDRVTIALVLEWMETFAVVFRQELEKLSDDLVYKGMQTFYEAKDRIGYLPFERLLDSFIASDRMGIAQAFADIQAERLYYIEKHKQENELLLNDKAMVAKTISFIPLCMVIIAELIIPFVYFGLQQLSMF